MSKEQTSIRKPLSKEEKQYRREVKTEFHNLFLLNEQMNYDYTINKSICYLNIINPLKTQPHDDIKDEIKQLYDLGNKMLQQVETYKIPERDTDKFKNMFPGPFYKVYLERHHSADMKYKFLMILALRLINLAGNTMHYIYREELGDYKSNGLSDEEAITYYGSPDKMDFVIERFVKSMILDFESYEFCINDDYKVLK